MTEQSIGSYRKIRPLTSIRFFPALGVIWYHVVLASTGFNTNTTGSLTYRVFLEGRWAIALFFVLSGFILSYLYYESMRNMTARHVMSFYLNRCARIFPVHWLTMAVAFALSVGFYSTFGPSMMSNANPAGIAPDAGDLAHRVIELASSITLTQTVAPYGFEAYSFNGSAWSLSAELLFYFLFPFFMFAFVRLLRWRGIHVVALSLAIIALQMVRMTTVDDSIAIVEQLYHYPPHRLVEFVLGIGIGMMFFERPLRVERTRAGVIAWTYLEVLALAAMIASVVLAVTWVPYSLRQAGWYVPFIAILIYVLAHEGGLISRFLSMRGFVLLGDMSFAIYMWQLIVIAIIDAMYDFSDIKVWSITVAICLVLGYITFRWFEMPLRRGIRRRGEVWLDKRLDEPLVHPGQGNA